MKVPQRANKTHPFGYSPLKNGGGQTNPHQILMYTEGPPTANWVFLGHAQLPCPMARTRRLQRLKHHFALIQANLTMPLG